jgi:hypothetical protein
MQRGLAICARPSFSSMVSGQCEKVCPFVHFPGTLLFRRATQSRRAHRKRSVLLSTSDPRVAAFLYLSSIH